MTIAGNNAGRVSQGRYWAMFGINIVVMGLLVVGAASVALQGRFGLGLLMIAGIAPLAIYWRVIMMRRCRDIGWPAAAPWILFGIQIAISFNIGSNLGTAATAATAGAAGAVGAVASAGSAFLLASLVSTADFVFTIVIGCIGSKQAVDYRANFGDGPGTLQSAQPRDGEPRQGGPDRFDDAIARALEAHRRKEAAAAATQLSHSAPVPAARQSAGFGRRVVG